MSPGLTAMENCLRRSTVLLGLSCALGSGLSACRMDLRAEDRDPPYVRRVLFGPGIRLNHDQLLGCAYVDRKKELTCFDPETLRLMEPRDP